MSESDLQHCPECGHDEGWLGSTSKTCQKPLVDKFPGIQICGHRCTFPVSATEAGDVTHYGLLTQDANTLCGAGKPPDGPLVTTSTHDYVTCGLCKAKLAEAGEGQDSNNAAQNSGGVGVESPRPALAYCPFRGTLPTLVQQQFDKRWMVGCGNAGCLMQPRTHLSYSQEEALMCWNTRRSFTSNVPE